jgi:anti-sigma regulatory factor (Ser/Thr protein kinase)
VIYVYTLFQRHPLCVVEARKFVRACLRRLRERFPEESTVELLTSELVTNALVHGGGPITVRVDLREEPIPGDGSHDTVRIEVGDTSPVQPEVKQVEADEESGRGMLLVDALAPRWGVKSRPGPGKAVWFEFAS